MDFFESQDKAQRKTKILVFYFVLAVIGITLAVYAVVMIGVNFSAQDTSSSIYAQASALRAWAPEVFFPTAIGVLAVILLGSGFKTLALSAGGSAVAADLGGRRVDPQTSDPEERRLLNVVEEMAIASGTPVPEVYLLENEDGINAFAAGKTPSDAVIGVTRGTVRYLSREELQGVIAHEFSHILNGDMRLNMRLIGLLFGILFLTLIGRGMMRVAFYSGGGRSDKKGGALAIGLLGLALILIGYIGVLFGKLIKAAISRQREFLADASAVQFTRNPDGIAGALKKIGGLTRGSKLESPNAEEASHLFFANGLTRSFAQSFATHPPLDVRIKAIDPSWNGKWPKVKLPGISAAYEDERKAAPSPGSAAAMAAVSALSESHVTSTSGATMEEAISEMVSPSGARLGYAAAVRAGLPEDVAGIVRNPAGGQALIFAFLIAQDDALRETELEMLRAETDPRTFEIAADLQRRLAEIHSSQKIALIDLALPALRRLSAEEYERFLRITQNLIEADQQIDLFEFMLQKIIRRHLDMFFDRAPAQRIRFRNVAALAGEANVLVSTLALLGQEGQEEVAAAYREGASLLTEESGLEFAPLGAADCGLDRIGEALDRIDQATPLVKKKILCACGKTVMTDNRIESREAELLRAIADTIGVPIPPFVRAG